MKRTIAWVMVLVCVGLHAIADGGALVSAEWSTREVFRHDQVAVHLLYRPEASLSDEDWLKLQFNRLGDKKTKLTDVSYRIESERFSADAVTLDRQEAGRL